MRLVDKVQPIALLIWETFMRPNFILLVISFLISSSSYGATHLSLSGSNTDSNAGLQNVQSGSVGGGLSMDLGSYFRIGFTHRQQISNTTGYLYDEDGRYDDGQPIPDEAGRYSEYSSKSHMISNSVDLTIILYAGEIFTPYIFGGVGVKSYVIETKEGNDTKRDSGSFPAPNGGAGLSIKLNQRFSLKMFHTVSPGIKKLPEKEPESTIDTYSQIGIEYSL